MLLDWESPKYLGNEEGLLNIELMRKLYHIIAYNLAKSRVTQDGARSHKSRAAVDYTPIGVEPHGPTRGVWPIATVANDSPLHLVASSI